MNSFFSCEALAFSKVNGINKDIYNCDFKDNKVVFTRKDFTKSIDIPDYSNIVIYHNTKKVSLAINIFYLFLLEIQRIFFLY